MKIIIIGFNHPIVDMICSQVEKLNHDLVRVNLHVSEKNRVPVKNDAKIKKLELRNFHDLTIEIVDFEPDKILYFPISGDKIINQSDEEINEITHIELVKHILETSQMVGSNCYFFNLKNKDNKLIQRSKELVNQFSKSVIVDTNMENFDINTIFRK